MTSICTAQPAWLQSVLHFGTADYLSNPRPALKETIMVKLRTPADAPIQQVVLRSIPNGEQQFTLMERVLCADGWQDWTASLTVLEKRTPYRFGIQTGDAVWWINAAGASQEVPFDLFDFKLLADTPAIPWLRQAVFYQIFPDRFENGDSDNDPVNEQIGFHDWVRQTLPWGEPFPYQPGIIPFYGGDLQGITQRLGYLQDLGVNAIYLNPIFTAYTNHRYDVTNYLQVDPVLGGDRALIDLRQALSDAGMHFILDIVPNHCGFGHPWFQKARQDPDSPEAQFFYFDDHPSRYESWMGHGSLPKLNYQSQFLRQRMYAGEEGVFRYWLRSPFSADGWRVDVANMLGRHNEQQLAHEVIPGIRQAVKDTNSKAYLIGENFFEAASQLQGDGWDGVMNYTGFADPLLHWLRPFHQGALGWQDELVLQQRWGTETLVKSWQDHLASIPWSIALQQFNVLDSHDTSRVLTELGGDEILVRLAAVAQFTFPGVPCVYYGDEIGLADAAGFGSRNCMPWDSSAWNQEMFRFYQQLISLRKSSRVLAEGSFQVLYWDDDLLLYQRMLGEERVLVSVNRNPQVTPARSLLLPQAGFTQAKRFAGLFSGKDALVSVGQLYLPDQPKGGEIWLAT
ncbi:MAG: alpha-amylase family glycosyl hydrolase [Anaerolineaceae bacterium]